MSAIPKELFGLKVEVVRSKRKTSALHIIGDELQIRVPNRVRDGKIVEILETKKIFKILYICYKSWCR